MRASVAGLPDLHSAHEVTRVTSTVYGRAERVSGAWRGHSPFSLEMDIYAFVLQAL